MRANACTSRHFYTYVMSYPPIIHPLTKTLAVDGTRSKCRFCEFTFRRICWAQSHPGNTQVPPGCACVVIFRSYRNVNFESTPLNLFLTSTLAPDQRHSIGGCVAARPDHQCYVLQCQPSNSRRSDQLRSCNAAYSKHLPTLLMRHTSTLTSTTTRFRTRVARLAIWRHSHPHRPAGHAAGRRERWPGPRGPVL